MKFNWRIIVIHSIAAVFVAMGWNQFGRLNNLEIIRGIYEHGAMNYLAKGDIRGRELTYFFLWKFYIALIGQFLLLCISLLQTVRHKAWVNSVAVFIIGFIATIIVGNYLHPSTFVFGIGKWFEPFGIEYYYVANGIFYSLLALLLMFSKRTKEFAFIHAQGMGRV